jgi:hypothetical protein
MPFYGDADQLYTCLQELFAHIQNEAPDGVQALMDSKLVIRFRCVEPAAQITINGRLRPPQITYGASTLRPDLDAELACDTLHRILLDELSLRGALGTGLMKVRGPVWKTDPLGDLIQAGRQFYPQLMRQKGSIT